MRKFFIVTFTSLIVTLISSCTCAFLDCVSDDYYFQFDIVRATDSADLVFGRHRVYDKREFQIYSLKGTDTTFYELRPFGYEHNPPEDSLLTVNFYPPADTAYMQLSNGDMDTLAMSFETIKTKCCGTIERISNYRLNNKIDLPGSEGKQLIIK